MALVLFCIFLASCFAAGATGAMFPPGDWYDGLKKPSWNPPNWLFPVAWTTLYLLMSFAATRVALSDGAGIGTGIGLALFALQIALNTLWTPVFFGLRRMGAALVVVALLWVAVLATMIAFWQVDTLAGIAFIPYLVWVTVATALNATVLRLNPDAKPA